jgi:hypothetical protein
MEFQCIKLKKKYRVSAKTIRKHFGKRQTNKRTNLSNDEKSEIRYLYNLGVKKCVIQKKFNIHYHLLNKIIKDNNNNK